jgi:hypothetical protein
VSQKEAYQGGVTGSKSGGSPRNLRTSPGGVVHPACDDVNILIPVHYERPWRARGGCPHAPENPIEARPVEVRTPARPNPGAPVNEQLVSSLLECIAWMDAGHRGTPLSRAILEDARRVLALATTGGIR